MQNYKNKKRLQIAIVVVVAVLAFSVGYASISSINLTINGNSTASVESNNYRVKFLSQGADSYDTAASTTHQLE